MAFNSTMAFAAERLIPNLRASRPAMRVMMMSKSTVRHLSKVPAPR